TSTDGVSLIHAASTAAYGATGATFKGDNARHGIIIPRESAKHIAKLFGAGAMISSDMRRVVITNGKLTLTSRLIDATYPAWSQIVPPTADNAATVSVCELAAALRRAEAAAGHKSSDGDGDKKLFPAITLSWAGAANEIHVALGRGDGEAFD